MSISEISSYSASTDTDVNASPSVSAPVPSYASQPIDPKLLEELSLQIGAGQVQLSQLPAPLREAVENAEARLLGDAQVSIGSDLQSVLALFQQFAQKMKAAAMEARAHDSLMAENTALAAANSLANAADDRKEAGYTDAESDLAAGAVGFAVAGGATAAGVRGYRASSKEDVHRAELGHQQPNPEGQMKFARFMTINRELDARAATPNYVRGANEPSSQLLRDRRDRIAADPHFQSHQLHVTKTAAANALNRTAANLANHQNNALGFQRGAEAASKTSAFTSADQRNAADNSDVDNKRKEAEEQRLRNEYDVSNEWVGKLQDCIQAARDSRQAIQRRDSETNQRITQA